MTISLIVAMSQNRVIGKDGGLPWRLSADLRRFKQLTMGHHIVMGRKTFESIGRILPGRTMVIITRQADFDAHGALVANSLDEALQLSSGDDEVFIIGGAEIYRQALSLVDRIYMTQVKATVDGDTYLELDLEDWTETSNETHCQDDKNEFDFSFNIYERNNVREAIKNA